MTKALVERMLGAELVHHLKTGSGPVGRLEDEAAAVLANCRKGYSAKTVLSDSGAMQIEVPRDRAGSFEPLLAPKWQKKLPGFEEKIIALYARGMTVRDIKAMLEAQYHIEVSAEFLQWIDETIRGKN